jgi:hypothetical protein
MKTTFLVLLFSIMAVSVNAQNKSTLIYKNAIEQDKKMQKAGYVLTIIGGATFFAGNIMYKKIYNDSDRSEPSEDKLNTYRNIMFGGLGLMAVGIPIWAIGTVKERNISLDAELFKFQGTNYISGIGIKVRF